LENSSSIRSALIADVVGISMLAVQLYLIFRFVPDDGTRFLLGLLSFIVLASVALYMWHAEKNNEANFQTVRVGRHHRRLCLFGSIKFRLRHVDRSNQLSGLGSIQGRHKGGWSVWLWADCSPVPGFNYRCCRRVRPSPCSTRRKPLTIKGGLALASFAKGGHSSSPPYSPTSACSFGSAIPKDCNAR